MGEAERLVKASPLATGKAVNVKKGEGRGVYVNAAPVFTQKPRHAKDGQLVGEFSGLKLR